MDSLLWLMIFIGLMIYIGRLLLFRGFPIINPQAVRRFLIQRMVAEYPAMKILKEEGLVLTLQIQDQLCMLNIDQLLRRCAESPAQTGIFLRQALNGLEAALREADDIPSDWEQLVIPLLLPPNVPYPTDFIVRPLPDTLVIGYALNEGPVFRWLTTETVSNAGIDLEHLHTIAMRNLERSCNALIVDSPHRDAENGDHFLQFLTGDGLDAARVLMPSFYQRFSPRFKDNDLLVAIPSRDSLAMVSKQDTALVKMLAWRSAQERSRRAYPLYPHLLLVGENGLLPWPPK